MRKSFVLALALLVTFAAGAAAGGNKHWVTLYNDGTINGAAVKAGEYKMLVEGGEAVFFRGKKEVARTAVREESVGGKIDRNSVVYQGEVITEIRLSGQSSKLVLSPGSVATTKSEKSSKTN